MFVYEKKLQYPVKVATPNPKLAAVIISQYGGPDGELGASLRYHPVQPDGGFADRHPVSGAGPAVQGGYSGPDQAAKHRTGGADGP